MKKFAEFLIIWSLIILGLIGASVAVMLCITFITSLHLPTPLWLIPGLVVLAAIVAYIVVNN